MRILLWHTYCLKSFSQQLNAQQYKTSTPKWLIWSSQICTVWLENPFFFTVYSRKHILSSLVLSCNSQWGWIKTRRSLITHGGRIFRFIFLARLKSFQNKNDLSLFVPASFKWSALFSFNSPGVGWRKSFLPFPFQRRNIKLFFLILWN